MSAVTEVMATRKLRHRTLIRQAGSAAAVLTATAGLLTGALHPAAAATGTGTGSPTTLSGTGAYANLKVTVSQTQDLINQDVSVSWSGGTPTVPSSGDFYTDFVQIMQCWGDDPATGPDPSQCEYGGLSVGATVSGEYVTTREVATTGLVDPLETDVPAGYNGPNV